MLFNQHGSSVGYRVGLMCVTVGAVMMIYRSHITTYMRPTTLATGGIAVNEEMGMMGIQLSQTQSTDGRNTKSGSVEAANIANYQDAEANGVQYRNLNINMTAPSRQLWPNDTQCDRLTVRPGQGITKTWLLSFPRSGNTWTRYLIEAATGVSTTSVYHDKLLVRLGFQGEREDIDTGTTLLQKTHDTRWIRNPTDPVILLVRDPSRAIISFWSWTQLNGRPDQYNTSIPAERYKTPGFHLFVWARTLEWSRMISKAVEKYENLTTLYYEDLVRNPLKEVRRLLHFLRVKPDEERLECVARHLEGPFKGAKKILDPYSVFEKKILKSAVVSSSQSLERSGYTPLPVMFYGV
ncbi:WSCD family member GA21586-like [Penaeus japonicus]|uniref:WSCD family member GA21586-like n=1 Tax=Penaeus japonicus TaxID=27405 RepID=UPI001C71773F|nr:WSCD family member GA21586-like [Penaeus japonicus]